MIIINMEKARDIHRDKMRDVRDPLLKKLDADYMIAVEHNQDTSQIAAKKQALRDVTANSSIDSAQTPEELKAVWPDILKV
jgi:hypothetical protein